MKVKPSEIPDSIDIDVSELAMGETLTVGDVREKIKFNVMNEDDFTLASVGAPRSDEELETTADEPAVDESAEVEEVEGETTETTETKE